ncbi:MAG TPA: 50S ribosomal protein L11 methyltransferase [Candidatus Limnocylindrales bacterium]|nr:50S ribosomal protein L11 methyltransferase [Candidatus Limnocylindrales bacterium]
MRWLELSVTADVEAVEAVSEILGRVAGGSAVHPTALVRDPDDELAAREDVTAPYVVTAHVEDGPAAADQVDSTERALWHLQAFGLRPVGPLRVRAVDDVDWSEAWKRHYVPQRIGRVVVVPSWVDERPRTGDVTIRLDPGMAFGTGLHPTTRGCLALLQDLPMPGVVLDVGCGSGILAISALALGAGHARGLDTDPVAVRVARENGERNGVAHRLVVSEGSLPAEAQEAYPLVMANLVAAVLLELAPRLASHTAPGGTLVAGGIIEPRADEVIWALEAVGLRSVHRRDDGEWVSLRLERTE